jgi:hypothetical protein
MGYNKLQALIEDFRSTYIENSNESEQYKDEMWDALEYILETAQDQAYDDGYDCGRESVREEKIRTYNSEVDG